MLKSDQPKIDIIFKFKDKVAATNQPKIKETAKNTLNVPQNIIGVKNLEQESKKICVFSPSNYASPTKTIDLNNVRLIDTKERKERDSIIECIKKEVESLKKISKEAVQKNKCKEQAEKKCKDAVAEKKPLAEIKSNNNNNDICQLFSKKRKISSVIGKENERKVKA